MDAVVRAAMARWPDVPDVHGWLLVDARGRFRLRSGADEAAGFEPITNDALNAFIARNYGGDARGRWFFQNGPQRVFARLALAPWIFRLDTDGTLRTHTGQVVDAVHAAAMDEDGRLFLDTPRGPGAVDDRDLALAVERLTDAAGRPLDDDRLLAWLTARDSPAPCLRIGAARVPLEPIARNAAAAHFGFDPVPAAD